MNERFHLTKLDAARRQLKAAIRLLFDGADPVVVHTLVGAASAIISDLVDRQHPQKSWDRFVQEANNLSPTEYFQIMRKPQNFLKHACYDAAETLDFDPIETESVAFWAVMNSENLAPLSIEESVFRLWYLACHAPVHEEPDAGYESMVEGTQQLFSDLRGCPRPDRIAAGRIVLTMELSEKQA